VGDVEACVDLFFYFPSDLVHLTLVSSASFSIVQVVAAHEAVVPVAVLGVVPEVVAGAAVAMEAVSSVKPSELF
jgi:hypothetical protein